MTLRESPGWPVTGQVDDPDGRYAEVGWREGERRVFVQLGASAEHGAMAFTLREGLRLARGLAWAVVAAALGRRR